MLLHLYTTQLAEIYGTEIAQRVTPRLQELISRYTGRIPKPAESSLTERDSFLITYGDQVRQPAQPHLKTLKEFCEDHLRGVVSSLHILPCFPWSSDDGFSVKDYRLIDPPLGDWSKVERLAASFRLMIDGVINHASVQGDWFQTFLRDEQPHRHFFLTVEGEPDLSQVVRPRASPLLTEFQASSGRRHVWTTFSADQADLDYHHPEVLLEVFDILLFYVERGASFLRLDAIAYLWKEIGTSCIHLPQTHAIIRLLRTVLDEVAPHVRLVTETNVPHEDNISYFGDGRDEAQLVYNFALPPLVLHTLRTGDARVLSRWASSLGTPSDRTTFINFLASHDGIGLNPTLSILSQEEIDGLVDQTKTNGGLISYKENTDGTQSPYELNINYFDALSNPGCEEPLALQVEKFMVAQAIMLCLRGVPGIYFHSLFGSRNWLQGVYSSGHNRTINRQKFQRAELEEELADPKSLRSRIFLRYRNLLFRRSASPAFHPHSGQKILDFGSGVFAVLRSASMGGKAMLCLHNVTAQEQHVSLDTGKYSLGAYQSLWLESPSLVE